MSNGLTAAAGESLANGGGEPAAADARLDALIRSRFDALMETWPNQATYLGVHAHDGRLADLSRAAKEADMAAEARFISEVEAGDATLLSERGRFERDLALHGARLRLFEAEVIRGWQRRASATQEIGDALFLLLVRDFAPFEERLEPLTRRLEAVPTALHQACDRLGDEPVRLWNELEIEAARELPALVHEIVTEARGHWLAGTASLVRLERAARATRQWLRADEQARLGRGFSLKGFHDALLYSGSLPIPFHRRLLAGDGGGPASPGS